MHACVRRACTWMSRPLCSARGIMDSWLDNASPPSPMRGSSGPAGSTATAGTGAGVPSAPPSPCCDWPSSGPWKIVASFSWKERAAGFTAASSGAASSGPFLPRPRQRGMGLPSSLSRRWSRLDALAAFVRRRRNQDLPAGFPVTSAGSVALSVGSVLRRRGMSAGRPATLGPPCCAAATPQASHQPWC